MEATWCSSTLFYFQLLDSEYFGDSILILFIVAVYFHTNTYCIIFCNINCSERNKVALLEMVIIRKKDVICISILGKPGGNYLLIRKESLHENLNNMKYCSNKIIILKYYLNKNEKGIFS